MRSIASKIRIVQISQLRPFPKNNLNHLGVAASPPLPYGFRFAHGFATASRPYRQLTHNQFFILSKYFFRLTILNFN